MEGGPWRGGGLENASSRSETAEARFPCPRGGMRKKNVRRLYVQRTAGYCEASSNSFQKVRNLADTIPPPLSDDSAALPPREFGRLGFEAIGLRCIHDV
ncbi:hypothetical protein KM043_007530 [Ampulex compressa]|nr:hypothetical protein KM043_007530 [Ampulex compressa]